MLAPMSEELLGAILGALERERVRYALFGGIAVGAHGISRATKDLDLFLDPAPANVEAARRALARALADPALDELTPELVAEYGLVRYGLPEHDFAIDLTTRIGEAFRFEDLETERREVAGVSVPVVTARQLIRMKEATGRPQDAADVVRLRDLLGEDHD